MTEYKKTFLQVCIANVAWGVCVGFLGDLWAVSPFAYVPIGVVGALLIAIAIICANKGGKK